MHDLRVSIRRLRALFRAAPLIAPKIERPGIIRDLRSLMFLLSRFRDLQVQQALLAPLAGGFPCLVGYTDKLRSSEAWSEKALAARLSSFPVQLLAGEVEAISLRLRRVLAGGKEEAKAAGRLSERLIRAHHRLSLLRSGIAPADPATIHRLRVAFKKYRYLVEPLAPLSSNPDPEVLTRMHDLQGVMGDIQDLAVLVRGLRSWAAASHKLREIEPALKVLAQRLEDKISGFQCKVDQMDSFAFELRQTNSK